MVCVWFNESQSCQDFLYVDFCIDLFGEIVHQNGIHSPQKNNSQFFFSKWYFLPPEHTRSKDIAFAYTPDIILLISDERLGFRYLQFFDYKRQKTWSYIIKMVFQVHF